MNKSSNPICIGKVGAAQGLKGHVRIHSWTDPDHQIFNYSPWSLMLNGNCNLVTAKKVEHGKHLIAEIKGIDDRNLAQALTHAEIFVDREAFPNIAKDEYYYTDMIGAKVINQEGKTLGAIEDIANFGAQDTLVVQQGKKTFYIPNIKQFVTQIDTENKVICVDWDEDF